MQQTYIGLQFNTNSIQNIDATLLEFCFYNLHDF